MHLQHPILLLTTTLFTLLNLTPLTSSACTRLGLTQALDSFFANAIIQYPLRLSPTLKISSNGYLQPSLNTTAYANTTSLLKPDFKVQAIDTTACQASRYTAVTQKSSNGTEVPALVSLRLGLEDLDGPISEIEILNVLKGDHILFSPEKFEPRTPALFNSSQAFPPGSRVSNTTKLTRAELIATANTYLEGVERGNNSLVKAGPLCPRISNGLQTSSHCDQGLQQFRWPVVNRRWIADTETGVAFGVFIFRGALGVGNGTGDLVNEFIAVKEGRLREIRAAMVYVRRDLGVVWEEGGTGE